MVCPKCGKNIGLGSAGVICVHCGYSDVPATDSGPEKHIDTTFARRHNLNLLLHGLLVLVLVFGVGWNIALIVNPDLVMLFWLFITIPIYFLFTSLVISLPFTYPPSAFFAWLFDKRRTNRGGPLFKYVILVNLWTLIAAALVYGIFKWSVSWDNSAVMTLTDNMFGKNIILQSLLVAIIAPLFWTGYVGRLSWDEKKLRIFTFSSGMICLSIYTIVSFFSYSSALELSKFNECVGRRESIALEQNIRPEDAEVSCTPEEKLAEAKKASAEAKIKDEAEEANLKQIQKERDEVFSQVKLTPYSVTSSEISSTPRLARTVDIINEKKIPSISLEFDIKNTQTHRKITINEFDPDQPYACINGQLPLPLGFGPCKPILVTPKNIAVFEAYFDFYFMINDTFFKMAILKPIPGTDGHYTSVREDELISKIVDMLQPVSWDKVER